MDSGQTIPKLKTWWWDERRDDRKKEGVGTGIRDSYHSALCIARVHPKKAIPLLAKPKGRALSNADMRIARRKRTLPSGEDGCQREEAAVGDLNKKETCYERGKTQKQSRVFSSFLTWLDPVKHRSTTQSRRGERSGLNSKSCTMVSWARE